MGRLTPLYAGLSAADRKRKERDWAYRHLFGLCDDLTALCGSAETEDDSIDDIINEFIHDDDDKRDSQFNRRLAALERLLGKRQEA
jgi:hypothetical protein